MPRAFFWIGGVLCAAGIVLIGANLVMNAMGLGASYNFGDPAKFEFILVPFWEIGLAVVAMGGACLLSGRWLRKT
jgi:hypothetical protein